MKDEERHPILIHPSAFIPHPCFSGRDSSRQNGDCWERGVPRGMVGLTPRPESKDEVGRMKDEHVNSREIVIPHPSAFILAFRPAFPASVF